MDTHEAISHDDEAALLAPQRGYNRFDLGIVADRGGDRFHHQRTGSSFKRPKEIFCIRGGVRIVHGRGPPDVRRDLLDYLQPLAPRGALDIDEAREIAAWPRQSGDEPRADRIGNRREHDRDRAGFLLQRGSHLCGANEDHVGLQLDKLLSERPRAVDVRIRPPLLDPHVAAVRPPQSREFLDEYGEPRSKLRIALGPSQQHADVPHPLALLCPRRERPRRRRAAERANELTSPHIPHPSSGASIVSAQTSTLIGLKPASLLQHGMLADVAVGSS